ncbi:MAG: substrate-binding domain-containing protein [Deferrisomatales bacterium]
MGRLPFAFACSPYDRMAALLDGSIVPEGLNLNFIPLEVEETFWRQLRHQEFDGCEMSFSSYTLARSRGDDRFVALPVFTSRFFRHSCVYVNTGKGINRPADLRGRVVGVPEYQMTAALWLRGIFQDEYGVHPREVRWRTGGEETPGRVEKLALQLPADVECRPIGPDQTLSRMLDEGELDALFTARAPSCFLRGSPNVARLFPDYAEVERQYYLKTGIFPLMHCVVLKRAFYEANPWAARSLYKACLAAKDQTLRNLRHTFALHATLPWLVREVERTREIMGEDWWPYGVEKNRRAIEALCRYSFEQGLSARQMTAEELFAPETLDEFKI